MDTVLWGQIAEVETLCNFMALLEIYVHVHVDPAIAWTL